MKHNVLPLTVITGDYPIDISFTICPLMYVPKRFCVALWWHPSPRSIPGPGTRSPQCIPTMAPVTNTIGTATHSLLPTHIGYSKRILHKLKFRLFLPSVPFKMAQAPLEAFLSLRARSTRVNEVSSSLHFGLGPVEKCTNI